MIDLENLQACISFQNISIQQAAFWNKKGITFTVEAGKVIPVENKINIDKESVPYVG